MKPWQYILLISVFIIGTIVRCYKIDNPVTEWHSHRQADTSSVTKNFVSNGINLLLPTYHDLSDVQSGKDNPRGLRMVELPIYNAISTAVSKSFPKISIEIIERIVSIVFTLLTALYIFLFAKKIIGLYFPSLLATSIFLFLPYNIFFSRTILPEPAAVFFMIFSLYYFPTNFVLSALGLALSVLIKPYTAIILFPTFLYLIYIHKSKLFKKAVLSLIFLLISFVPFILWRRWITQFPEGIPSSSWLFNNSTTPVVQQWFHGYNLTWLNKMVAFRPHWFHWLFKERLADIILGTFGLIPFALGFALRKKQSQPILFSFSIGILLYFIIVAQGNIQHDYYQYLITPQISIITGFGFYYLINFLYQKKIVGLISSFFIFVLSIYFSWEKVKSNYVINNQNIVIAGKKVDEITPKNSLVIAPYTGDTAFLYQTNRSGWPTEIYPETILSLKKQHPQNPLYLVSINNDQYTNTMSGKFKTLFKDNNFIILDLN